MKKKMMRNAVLVGILLLVPLVFTIWGGALGFNWGPLDFVFAFVIPMGAALLYELIALKVTRNSHRLAVAIAVTLLVCVIWVELATNAVSKLSGF